MKKQTVLMEQCTFVKNGAFIIENVSCSAILESCIDAYNPSPCLVWRIEINRNDVLVDEIRVCDSEKTVEILKDIFESIQRLKREKVIFDTEEKRLNANPLYGGFSLKTIDRGRSLRDMDQRAAHDFITRSANFTGLSIKETIGFLKRGDVISFSDSRDDSICFETEYLKMKDKKETEERLQNEEIAKKNMVYYKKNGVLPGFSNAAYCGRCGHSGEVGSYPFTTLITSAGGKMVCDDCL